MREARHMPEVLARFADVSKFLIRDTIVLFRPFLVTKLWARFNVIRSPHTDGGNTTSKRGTLLTQVD